MGQSRILSRGMNSCVLDILTVISNSGALLQTAIFLPLCFFSSTFFNNLFFSFVSYYYNYFYFCEFTDGGQNSLGLSLFNPSRITDTMWRRSRSQICPIFFLLSCLPGEGDLAGIRRNLIQKKKKDCLYAKGIVRLGDRSCSYTDRQQTLPR